MYLLWILGWSTVESCGDLMAGMVEAQVRWLLILYVDFSEGVFSKMGAFCLPLRFAVTSYSQYHPNTSGFYLVVEDFHSGHDVLFSFTRFLWLMVAGFLSLCYLSGLWMSIEPV